jgi:glycosyltransferase involved in cell wall biosynthesis
MVTPDDVTAAYRAILARAPDRVEIDAAVARFAGLEALGAWLLAQRGIPAARAEAARARRVLQRYGALRQELQETRRTLQGIETSVAWHAAAPVRMLGAALPAGVRRRASRIARLAWWGATLNTGLLRQAARGGQPWPGEPSPEPAHTDARPHALVIDNRWPQPDRDSGSLDMINLIDSLLALGFAVSFVADAEFGTQGDARDALAARGVQCVDPAVAASTVDLLEQQGHGIALCVLSRLYGGGRFLEDVLRHCPAARLVFMTVDLHFLRAEREAALGADITPEAVERMKQRELLLVREADATMVVSDIERRLLLDLVPDAFVVELPLARAVRRSSAPFAARHHVGFVGGFAHTPNIDALLWFLRDIWPLVAQAMPDCRFSVVGADLPDAVLAEAPHGVHYLGHLPELDSWFASLRLTVAPLRFGAGAKGKIASSLAAGVPCITTPIGAEGMRLRAGETVLVADSAEAFAACLHEAYTDGALWHRLSDAGLRYADRQLSPVAWRTRLQEMLSTIGALPPGGATSPDACKPQASGSDH